VTSIPAEVGTESPFWWRSTLDDGVHLGFSSIAAGNLARHVGPQTDVAAHRTRLQEAMGIPEGSLRFLDQVHSADVIDAGVADSTPRHTHAKHEPVLTGDAWVCADGSVPLAIMVADCLPVLLVGRRADPQAAPVTAAAHAGRPGLLSGILENTISAMREHGASTITAWIGPGVCGECYEIPEAMVTEVSRERPHIASTTRWGTSALDLRAEAEAVLTGQNVAVAELSGCTLEDESLYSHRRAPGEGRFAGLIWTTPPPHQTR